MPAQKKKPRINLRPAKQAEEGKYYDVTVSGMMSVPSNWTPIEDSAGALAAGWRLPDGREIKVWFSYELYDPETDQYRDLTSAQSVRFGIEGCDFDRHDMELHPMPEE